MLAHNILYTYIAPYVSTAGLSHHVDGVLLVFGTAALVGIWVTGRLVDRHLRAAVLVSISAFAAVSVFLGLFSGSPVAVFAGVFVWGLTFGGAATLLQTALADAAGEGADVALSMNVVVWNSAIAGVVSSSGAMRICARARRKSARLERMRRRTLAPVISSISGATASAMVLTVLAPVAKWTSTNCARPNTKASRRSPSYAAHA